MNDRGANLDRLRSLDGVKWSRDGSDVLALWVADMDFAPAPPILDAIESVASLGDFGYNRVAGPNAKQAWIDWCKATHDIAYPFDEVYSFCEVLQAIEVVLWLEFQPDDAVVLFTPIYPPFIAAATGLGRRMVSCPLVGDDWRIDRATLEASIDAKTKAILLCNPHNPTGRMFDADELETVLAVAEAHDLLIISDEIWSDLTHPGKAHIPFLSLGERAARRLVTVSAASKSFSLAGFRFSVAHIGPPELRAKLDALPPHLLGGVNTIGAKVAERCWRDGAEWLADTRSFLTLQRDYVAERLRTDLPLVDFRLPEATYLAWLGFGAYGLGDDPADLFMAEERLAVSPGPPFGDLGHGWARINLATSREIVADAIDRIARVCLKER
ncbi:MAG: aminotransferase class I/II-fold pyridoxal phosphate-dependent enzyme [Acidimicrobiales bacterium]